MIGKRITAMREQMGLTQTDLARLLNISPSRISDFERGAKTDCNVSTVKRLARVLGVSIDYLVGTWDQDEALGDAAPVAEAPAATRRRGRPRKAAPATSAGARG